MTKFPSKKLMGHFPGSKKEVWIAEWTENGDVVFSQCFQHVENMPELFEWLHAGPPKKYRIKCAFTKKPIGVIFNRGEDLTPITESNIEEVIE